VCNCCWCGGVFFRGNLVSDPIRRRSAERLFSLLLLCFPRRNTVVNCRSSKWCIDLMTPCGCLLQECVEMSTRLLDASTRKPLLEIVEQHLLQPHLSQLIERGFKVKAVPVGASNLSCMRCSYCSS
jgi:hypothetical protein